MPSLIVHTSQHTTTNKGNIMKGSHVFNLHQQAMIHNTYDFSMVSKTTIETIAAARIWRNLGRKAALGYTAKRGIDMRLVRLACQLEAMNKSGFVLGAI